MWYSAVHMSQMETRTYSVAGMTCAHCVLSVREEVVEVVEVAGVVDVEVDLASGRLTMRGEGISDDEIRASVEEAGYRVVA
jgi:copper chaperone